MFGNQNMQDIMAKLQDMQGAVEESKKRLENSVKKILMAKYKAGLNDLKDVSWLSKKIINLRVFNDEMKIMNRSLIDISGELMIVSQFTLYAQTKKGNRPSYVNAAKGEVAEQIYKSFILEFKNKHGVIPQTGKFGHDMNIEFENNGPVTIIIDTKNK